jgi:hypothetical protein
MSTAPKAPDKTRGRGEAETSHGGVVFGIGATLLLFVGIWRLDRSSDRQRAPFMPDLEARYRARGIDPRLVF